MSRVVVLDLNNMSVGQFDAICTLGYTLDGHASVSGGGSGTIRIPDDVAVEDWLDFGRMIVIQPEDLPAYVGVIDTPWGAVSPATMTIYDPEYLLNLRAADAEVKFTGNVEKILRDIINMANNLEDLYLRMGTIYEIDQTYRDETLDARPLWEQVQALALRSGTEIVLRPKREDDKRWYIYIDIGTQLGIDTGFLLSDGDGGNMKVQSANVRGEIINRYVGINDASSSQSQLRTAPLTDTTSIQRYRMRNRVEQFQDVVDPNTLKQNTQSLLDASSAPYIELTVSVMNNDHAFQNLRPGNSVMAHASKITLPGGKLGWRGKARITKMAYDEATGTVGMILFGRI